MSLFKKISLAIAIVVASTIACETPDTDVDPAPFLAPIILTQLALSQEQFANSCDRILSASICENTYRAGNSTFSPDCLGSGTIESSKCPSGSSVGVCLLPGMNGGRQERVYYSIGLFPTSEAQARSFCDSNNGTFVTPYTP